MSHTEMKPTEMALANLVIQLTTLNNLISALYKDMGAKLDAINTSVQKGNPNKP